MWNSLPLNKQKYKVFFNFWNEEITTKKKEFYYNSEST